MRDSHGRRIVIVGAGPTGLGAADRLRQLGHDDWVVLEATDAPGGLARSFVDEVGFTWDIGGHVQFSHYEHFDELMNRVLGDEWLYHEREAWAWMFDRFVPYPVQNNIHRFPKEPLLECLLGMLEASRNHDGAPPQDFADWLRRSFGVGLYRHFMEPYNFKVWAYDPEALDAEWVGDRVARPDFERVLENVVLERDDISWGPNNRFRFPERGGTGEIWRRLAATFPEDRIRYESRVVGVSTAERSVELESGERIGYDALLSSMPLDRLAAMTDRPEIREVAPRLIHSSANIVGIGVEGEPPEHLETKCWMYFPESNCPFYRVTVFSNYSPNHVPEPGRQWSLMAEVSESPEKPVDHDGLVENVIRGMRKTGLLPAEARVVSTWRHRVDHGYPTPFLGRPDVVDPLIEELERHDIYSRGRFGAWKYEVSNQDHSVMQGVECVDRLLLGASETTLPHPEIVNGR